MRLIDADELLRFLDDDMFQQGFSDTAKIVIRNQPTAYDIDKVVGKLKKVSYERFGNDGMGGELVVNLDDAIEIVKAGGKDE